MACCRWTQPCPRVASASSEDDPAAEDQGEGEQAQVSKAHEGRAHSPQRKHAKKDSKRANKDRKTKESKESEAEAAIKGAGRRRVVKARRRERHGAASPEVNRASAPG